MSVGTLLRLRRVECGLSQSEVGRRSDMLPGVISEIEAGKRHPTVRTLERVAAALNCRVVIQLVPLGPL